jgi:hypothetical protein
MRALLLDRCMAIGVLSLIWAGLFAPCAERLGGSRRRSMFAASGRFCNSFLKISYHAYIYTCAPSLLPHFSQGPEPAVCRPTASIQVPVSPVWATSRGLNKLQLLSCMDKIFGSDLFTVTVIRLRGDGLRNNFCSGVNAA